MNLNFTPEQLEQIQKLMAETGGPTGMMDITPQVELPSPGVELAAPVPEPKQELAIPDAATAPPVVENFDAPQQMQTNLTPADPTPKTPAPAPAPAPTATVEQAGGMFQASGNDAYDAQIQKLMNQGKTYEQAVANQAHAIKMGKDLNGDGAVTGDEWKSPYTSAANPAVDEKYKNTGKGMGSVYISSAKDDDGIAGGNKFESLTRANDALLGEGQEWGFENGATGQWGTYGGPGFSQSAENIAEIDLNRTGYGTNGLVGGDMNLGMLYKDAGWTKADVSKGKLGQVVSTPMGDYMIVNGMDGQLALKGLKGAKHGGGNYFFRTVHEGYHLGINPETGDVWFQQAPEVVELARKVKAAGGDFTTAMTSGINSGDLGVWDDARRERFHNQGSDPVGGTSDPTNGGWSNNWEAWNWDTGSTFIDAYKKRKQELANKPSVMSLFKEMADYNG